MIFGVDDLKRVNSLYDRTAGDEVLRLTAQKIQSFLPPNAGVYRMDGDEFGVIVRSGSREDVQSLYRELQVLFDRQQSFDGKKFCCTLSCGCAFSGPDAADCQSLLRHVHFALDFAKSSGKNQLRFFSREVLAHRERAMELTELLRESVEHGFEGFELYYQPVFLSGGETLSGAEALCRWRCGKYGPISPVEFIPLLEESGLTPGEDVTIEWKTSEEVTALMASGGIDLCMLPVPAATSVMMQNADVRDAIDLNDVWQEVGAAGTFTMGCVVARSDFVEEHPEAVDAFLTEYAASIAYVNEHPEEAAALVEQYGIVPKAAVAKAAIMVCLTGDELKGISDYYEVLYAADPTSIGGAIPDDNFYYIP